MFNKFIESNNNNNNNNNKNNYIDGEHEEKGYYGNVPLPLNNSMDRLSISSLTPVKQETIGMYYDDDTTLRKQTNSSTFTDNEMTVNKPKLITPNNIVTNVNLFDLKEQINIAIKKTNTRIEDVLKLLDDELNNLYANVAELQDKQAIHEQLIQRLANEVTILRAENREKNNLHRRKDAFCKENCLEISLGKLDLFVFIFVYQLHLYMKY